MSSPRAPFDPIGPWPTGVTMLEASAGTGKTHAIGTLATRAVVERGLHPSQLCLVTFTEAATAELRGRVRSRLVEVAEHLAPDAPVPDDVVLAHLVDVDDGERAHRRELVAAALADFDTATISTIHGFCSRVVAGDGSTGAIVDDDTDLRELVVDRLLADYADVDPLPFRVDKLVSAVELRLRIPSAEMFTVAVDELPARTPKDTDVRRAELTGQAAALVDDLVAEARRRRAADRRRTFDGLLTDARDVLTGPAGAAAVAALRNRFRLVMIDEFQDTDTVQWEIFRTAFLEGPDPVDAVIVGDPKQSIYRFRSAELSAYLAARDHTEVAGGAVATLDTNWRTDRPLLDALGYLFEGRTFGHPEVPFQPVQAAPGRDGSRVVDGGAPLVIRRLPEPDTVPELRARVARDLVAEVVRLLSDAELVGADEGSRPLRASDIGVLVRSNRDAGIYAEALAAAGVPAARSSSDSVLDSPAAEQWRILLAALDRPADPRRARAAALGWFLGRPPDEVAELADEALAELVETLRRWAGLLTDRGLPALLGAVRDAGLLGRVLHRSSGERDLTDLDHVAELLSAATGGRRTSAATLSGVLTEMATAGAVADDEGVTSDLLARRIDRDDDTVKIFTVHKAKGLEFPVVLCPTLWTPPPPSRDLGHAFVDGRRLVDTVGVVDPEALGTRATGPAVFRTVAEASAEENRGEAMRLLYVALTRAEHRLVVWTATPNRSAASALRTLLTAPEPDPDGGAAGAAGEIDLPALASRSGGCIEVVDVATPAGRPHLDPVRTVPEMEAATARRRIDRTWAVWSFTGIEKAAHALAAHRLDVPGVPPPVLTDHMSLPPDVPLEGGNDEPGAGPGEDDAGGAGVGAEAAPPLLGVPGGRHFGTLVHSVLERTDFTSTTLDADLHDRAAELLRYRPLPVTADHVADGLGAALRAPLGGPLADTRLVDVPTGDRLDELDFDLPLASLRAGAIAEVLCDHLPADDVLRPWAVHAAAGALDVDVAGQVTGSIDLVARTPEGRVWLADYKTNRLPDGDYGRGAVAEAMVAAGYPLQATLYLVALHRYLRWRLAERYRPDDHLLGAAYLFVRGMDPRREADDARGVLWWRPPTAALDDLDALLAEGRVRT